MKNSEKDKIEKTSDFLDLMSRSERKAWERAQKDDKEKLAIEKEKSIKEKDEKVSSRQEKYKLNQEEKQIKSILKEEKPFKEKTIEENTQAIKSINEEELNVGELGKTQHFLNLTSELTTALGENIEENLFEEKEKPSRFNPITWIGFLIILCFGYFIYLVVQSGYDEELLLLINSGFLLGIVFLFGLSIISNRKWTKVFSILNFIVILAFIGINIFLLYDWNSTKEKKKKEEEPPIEESKIQTLSCTSSTLDIKINAKDDYITKLEQTFTFDEEEELEEISKIFEEQDGLTSKIDDKKLKVIFDFEKLDINQYKNMIREYLEYYRDSSDFTYVKEDKIIYSTYKDTELKEMECTEKTES